MRFGKKSDYFREPMRFGKRFPEAIDVGHVERQTDGDINRASSLKDAFAFWSKNLKTNPGMLEQVLSDGNNNSPNYNEFVNDKE